MQRAIDGFFYLDILFDIKSRKRLLYYMVSTAALSMGSPFV